MIHRVLGERACSASLANGLRPSSVGHGATAEVDGLLAGVEGEQLFAGLVVAGDLAPVDEFQSSDSGHLERAHREPVLVAMDVEADRGAGHHPVGIRTVEVALRRK